MPTLSKGKIELNFKKFYQPYLSDSLYLDSRFLQEAKKKFAKESTEKKNINELFSWNTQLYVYEIISFKDIQEYCQLVFTFPSEVVDIWQIPS